MPQQFDVIVIGVGAMGSSVCYHLAQRGVRVLGLDRFEIPNEMGSSGGYSRMFRLAYYEHGNYVILLQRAFELWQQLELMADQKLFHVTGGLYMGRSDSELVGGSCQAAAEHGIEHEILSHNQLADRFGQFHLPDDFVGFYEHKAGFLLSQPVIATQAELARCNGAALHGCEPVIEWQSDRDRVSVRTEQRTYHADELILCGGAWTSKLLASLNIQLRVTRQVMGWVEPSSTHGPFSMSRWQLGQFPVWAIELGIEAGYSGLHYGFPMTAGHPGLKIAHHFPAQLVDPDQVDRQLLPGDERTFRSVLRDYLPDADGPLRAMSTCLYTNSPDSHFIVDRIANVAHDHDRVTIACGFSGHGFKFASVMGQALADLAMNHRTDLPVGFLGLSRFKGN